MKFVTALAALLFANSAFCANLDEFYGQRSFTHADVKSGLIQLTSTYSRHYSKVKQEIRKASRGEKSFPGLLSSEERMPICRLLGKTENLELDPISEAFNYINLTNDFLLIHGTDENLLPTEIGRSFFELFSMATVYQLIALQNEHIRAKGFCSEKAEVLELDFKYNIIAVRPGNLSELSESVDFMLQQASQFKRRLESLSESNAKIVGAAVNGKSSIL